MHMIKSFNLKLLGQAMGLLGRRKTAFIILCLTFNLMDSICNLLFAFGLKGVINGVTLGEHTMFWQSIILIIIRTSVWMICTPLCAYLCDWASKHAMRNLNVRLADHIIRQPQSILDKSSVGEYISVMSNDTNCLQAIYDGGFSFVFGSLITGTMGFVTMFIIGWRVAIVVFLLGTLNVFVSSYASKKIAKDGEILQKQLAQNSADIHSQIVASKTIRLLHMQKTIKGDYANALDTEKDVKVRIGIVTAKMSSIQLLINIVGSTLILIIGAFMVYSKLTDWGTVIALTGLKGSSDLLFSGLGTHLATMQGNLQGVKRILNLLDQPVESNELLTNYRMEPTMTNPQELVHLSNITFGYQKEVPPILKGINLSLKKGEMTALVGDNGCGKSTLLKLMIALYYPNQGSITYQDDEGNAASLYHIRSKIAYISQDPVLLRDTVYNNLLFGNESATPDDVMHAARAAEADNFIQAMPDGYQTILTDFGRNLSGGQRQRIAIARALVKNVPILLCDEITSALDHETEQRIMDMLHQLKDNYAILYITHKPDIVEKADRVIYMENGVFIGE